MSKNIVTKADSPLDLLILLFADADSNPMQSVVRIDKMIQLLYELGRFPEAFEYRKEYGKLPKYGPFTEDLLYDLDALETVGLIRREGSIYYPSPFIRHFEVIYELTSIQKFQINLVRLMVNSHELNTLLQIVYHEKLRREQENVRQSLHKSKTKSDQKPKRETQTH